MRKRLCHSPAKISFTMSFSIYGHISWSPPIPTIIYTCHRADSIIFETALYYAQCEKFEFPKLIQKETSYWCLSVSKNILGKFVKNLTYHQILICLTAQLLCIVQQLKFVPPSRHYILAARYFLVIQKSKLVFHRLL